MEVVISAVVSAFISGIFLLSGYFVSKRLEKQKADTDTWLILGNPVLNAADELIARLFDMIVRQRPLDLSKPLSADGYPVFDPPREISTVWRLARFLATVTALENRSATTGEDKRLSQLRFYVTNKARIAMKGNLANAPFKLQTEGQQMIGTCILQLAGSGGIQELDFYDFLNALAKNEEVKQASDACRQFLNFERALEKPSSQRISVCLLAIYLIDALQDLRPTAKWEEFRIFLVSMIRAYNRSSSTAAIFLYKQGDLMSDNYLSTFNLLPQDRKSIVRLQRRIKSRNSGAFDRKVTSQGVVRTVNKDTITLNYNSNPGDLLNQLRKAFPTLGGAS